MKTLPLRQLLVDIARKDVGKEEVSRNQAPWIKKLWDATDYPDGDEDRQPYCAAGVAWCVREWLTYGDVLDALKLTPKTAERWRCRSASVFRAKDSWENWAKAKGLWIPGPHVDLNVGDLVIYPHSHIELVSVATGDVTKLIGYNTGNGVERDGRWCWEKPYRGGELRGVVRMLPREI